MKKLKDIKNFKGRNTFTWVPLSQELLTQFQCFLKIVLAIAKLQIDHSEK